MTDARCGEPCRSAHLVPVQYTDRKREVNILIQLWPRDSRRSQRERLTIPCPLSEMITERWVVADLGLSRPSHTDPKATIGLPKRSQFALLQRALGIG